MSNRVLITGASGLYGREFASHHLALMDHIIAVDRRANPWPNMPANRYEFIQRDIRFWNEYPAADIVINNAAVGDDASDNEILATNLAAAIRISKHYAVERAKVIVNIGSDHVFYDSRGREVYAASKSGLWHFTRIAARKWPLTQWMFLCPGNTHNPINPIVENEHLPWWFFVPIETIIRDYANGLRKRKLLVVSGTHAKLVKAVYRWPGGKGFLRGYNWVRGRLG